MQGKIVDERLLLMHQVMIGDRRRIEAYDAALARSIKPGDVVVDVGAGMLVLSLLALKHGARHVYAIEADPQIIPVAAALAEDNNLRGRLTLVQADARTVRLPERADVLVCEMMGNIGGEEEMPEIVRRVARHNLKPGGRIIPERLLTYLQAVAFDDEGWGVWSKDFHGYSLSAVQAYAPNRAQLHFFTRHPTLLSDAEIVSDDQLGRAAAQPRSLSTLKITERGELHALIGYFNAVLAPGIALSNFPSYPGCNWAVWTWPLRYSDVMPGDALRVQIQRPRNVRLAADWTLDCRIARADRPLRPTASADGFGVSNTVTN